MNFDFDGARQKLQECQTVVFNDFFLIALLNEFVENARLMIFETFCRIHQCISIQYVIFCVIDYKNRLINHLYMVCLSVIFILFLHYL